MTIRQLFREFTAARLRGRDDRNRDLLAAYQAVRIRVLTENHKQMPSLMDLLEREPRKTTFEDRKVQLELLAARFGGKVIEIGAPAHG